MGGAKDLQMQQMAQGWDFTDKHVCRKCVNDYALKAAIDASESSACRCDFCGSSPAADLDVLLEAFVDGLHNEYEGALGGVIYDSSEGGWQWGQTWDTWDLLDNYYDILDGEGLLDALREAIHDRTWVERNFAERRQDVVLTESWERFCDAVQYHTRYVFWLREASPSDDESPGEVPAARILDEVGNLIDRLELVRRLDPGERFWRAHAHGAVPIEHSAGRLGTVPRELALRGNRMSPAGIPMFYGAEHLETAIREVAFGSDYERVTFAAFGLTTGASIVDFTRLPAIPSMFDPELGHLRRALVFLHRFVDSLSSRIRPDHEEIDYVPTQIVTEYLLRVYGDGETVIGLAYPSSLTGEPCVVFDITNERCVDAVDPGMAAVALHLIAETVGSRALNDADRS